jgi:hypothetical protein
MFHELLKIGRRMDEAPRPELGSTTPLRSIFQLACSCWQGEQERRALPWGGLHPDAPAIPLHNLLANGQPIIASAKETLLVTLKKWISTPSSSAIQPSLL